MVEDLGNKDQMDFLVDHLFRAGATIVPLRPVGHQPHEVVLDNLDPGVTFRGNWQAGQGSTYFGPKEGVPYRFAATSAAETAAAQYRPNLPAAGVYPVYSWVTHGFNRAADQLYRIHHSGGATEVTINHRRVGNGPVYLGSYYFEKGDSGYVEISNRSSETGRVVIADMIRFGNGRGDIDRGGGVSGVNREDEAALYWVMWHAERSQGIPVDAYRASEDDRAATVSLAPRVAAFMNRQEEGHPTDRVFVSFHSNAGAGNSRGVLGLFNGNNYSTSRTPNQLLLAETLAREINDDLVARAGEFEHDWFDRGEDLTLDRTDIEFGELNNIYIHDEFDATIIETGFHDNQADAEMLRDPRVRDAIGRSTCQGLIRFFHAIDGGETPETLPPGPVGGVSARTTAAGVVTLGWAASADPQDDGDKPTDYVIYSSTNGYGFDSGQIALGGGTNTYSVAGLDPGQVYYFRVAAKNRGGESAPSEVVACRPSAAKKRVLIVNGFDRLDRQLNPRERFLGGGEVERVRPGQSNSGDYAAPLAAAIRASGANVAIECASNESLPSFARQLADYDAVFWSLGEESSADNTLDAAEQAMLRDYLSQGGSLFLSGAEAAWDLDSLNNGRAFMREVLHARFVADSAGVQKASGAAGTLFDGIRADFSTGKAAYEVESPDVIEPVDGAVTAMRYANNQGAAAIQYNHDNQRVVYLAFPFETIASPDARTEIMSRVVRFFNLNQTD